MGVNYVATDGGVRERPAPALVFMKRSVAAGSASENGTVGEFDQRSSASMRRVVRIDDDDRHMHGYIAHATLNKRRHQIYCSDVRYQTAERALAAAQLAVAVSLAEHNLYLALRRRHNRRQNTPGDIPGVNRIPRRAIAGTPNYWVARWADSTGKRHSRKFSVARFTEQGAYELALETRLDATVADRELLRTLNETTEGFQLIAPDQTTST